VHEPHERLVARREGRVRLSVVDERERLNARLVSFRTRLPEARMV